jgi:hypothetical protein
MTFIAEEATTVLTPKTPMLCSTNGKGLWSGHGRTTPIRKIEMEVGQSYLNLYRHQPVLPIYLKVYFPKKAWDIEKHGLIYTDDKWLADFREQFKARFPHLGWLARHIDYTEQGMQGVNYVSLECSLFSMGHIKKFDKSLMAMGKIKWKFGYGDSNTD